jgi:hypothetical protein
MAVEKRGLGPRVVLAERGEKSGVVAGKAERKHDPFGPGRWLGVMRTRDQGDLLS